MTYLCESASRYFRKPVTPADVRWTYAGVRPLLDDTRADVSKITRDYRIELAKRESGAPLLSVFGGKITTYRRLAESALEVLLPELAARHAAWTANAVLPGGDIPGGDIERFARDVVQRWPFLPSATSDRLTRAYGTRIDRVLGSSRSMSDLGEHFGGGLTEAEVEYLRTHEWAQSADDVLWRRTKLGLHLSEAERDRLARYLSA
jgi:glycerol-3-phosphate dehydrogenase